MSINYKEENAKPSYWGILPAIVRYDKNLSCMQKIMFTEITALQNSKGVCYASNRYFSKLYGVHKNTVGKWINELENQGYLKSQIIYKNNSKQVDKRLLFTCIDPINQKVDTPVNEKIDTYQLNQGYPINEKIEDNNTSINKEEEKKKEKYGLFVVDIFYLNKIENELNFKPNEIMGEQREFLNYCKKNKKQYKDMSRSFYIHLKGKREVL